MKCWKWFFLLFLPELHEGQEGQNILDFVNTRKLHVQVIYLWPLNSNLRNLMTFKSIALYSMYPTNFLLLLECLIYVQNPYRTIGMYNETKYYISVYLFLQTILRIIYCGYVVGNNIWFINWMKMLIDTRNAYSYAYIHVSKTGLIINFFSSIGMKVDCLNPYL